MSAVSKIEPDPLAFTLRPGGHGSWIVEGPCNCCGGIFVSREAALEFARRERRALEEVARHICYTPPGDAAEVAAAPAIRLLAS
ncbi:hypothetical protein [Aureimonas phyllosphaerae]|uniref:Uncharacterized protein n=1 Tax=Aureimonas phyllosphaerae TaxID=1166078 RepID=A0A7W6FVN1_9HYPH|nr:hypothetical protein [Aureimonas phyllosphaerae]MBB3936990.1 hypothetical protein [Aureimonas phyllosphaerae]MBB3960895.1 hypothetical protein [Aureimonas phyllosphaerae]SFF51529.1 hypothetical protein SAMN05216566_12031 [Aureimonas phyllosphaerae]